MSDTSTRKRRWTALLRRLVDVVPVPRLLDPLAGHAYSFAVRRGLLEYRPFVISNTGWDERYRAGAWDFLDSIPEMARMAVLSGYLHRYGKQATILDVGCGAGVLRQYAEGTGFERYVGIDPVPSAIEQARSRWDHDERTSFDVAEFLEFEHSPFDVIILSEILYMVVDPVANLARVGALLKPTGVLLVSIWGHPADDQVWNLIDDRFRLIDRVRVVNEGYERAPRGWRVACFRRP